MRQADRPFRVQNFNPCEISEENSISMTLFRGNTQRRMANTIIEGDTIRNIRNEIKAYIVREGFTMSELVEKLAEQYGWSPSVPNLSDKLRRESLRYKEAVELADALGYDLVWKKRR